MKKLTAMLLSLLMVIMILPIASAEEQSPSLTTLDWVKQLRENPLVSDVWVPVLPDHYSIEKISVNADGSYGFRIKNRQKNATKMQSIAIMPLTVTMDNAIFNSGYQYYLLEQGISSFPITQEVIDAVIARKNYTWKNTKRTRLSVEYNFAYPLTEYQKIPTAHLYFDYTKTVDGDIGFGSCHEMVMGIHPKTIASVIYTYTPPKGVSSIPQTEFLQTVQTDMAVQFVSYGDVDVNCKVNAKDALAILKHGVQKALITDELSLLLADCNYDGNINASDALFTLRKAVGK